MPSISLVSSQIVSFLFFVVDVVVSMMILLVGEERADGMRSIFFFLSSTSRISLKEKHKKKTGFIAKRNHLVAMIHRPAVVGAGPTCVATSPTPSNMKQ